jgi:hypothetical protein
LGSAAHTREEASDVVPGRDGSGATHPHRDRSENQPRDVDPGDLAERSVTGHARGDV